MKKIVTFILSIAYLGTVAQTYEVIGKDTINFEDINGKRQGKWIITNKLLHRECYTDDQK